MISAIVRGRPLSVLARGPPGREMHMNTNNGRGASAWPTPKDVQDSTDAEATNREQQQAEAAKARMDEETRNPPQEPPSQAKGVPAYVPFKLIDLGEDTSTRVKLSEDAIARYRDGYEAHVEMPPPVLFTEDDKVFYVGDGRHRLTAQNGLNGCLCDVRRGGKRDAIAFAAQADLNSAVPRTTDDRGRAVDLMLRDPVRGSWTNGEIARHCGVSDVTVGNHRRKLERTGEVERSRVRKSKSGREIDTGNIGKRVAAVPTPKSSESSEPTATSPHTTR